MQFPLLIGLRRSRRLALLLLVFHLAAAFSACIAFLPHAELPYRFVCLVLLLLIALSAWRSRCGCMPERLRLAADGTLSLYFPGLGLRQAQMISGGVASRHFAVLRLHIEGEKRACNLVLFPDQMPAAQFRQLVLCLRWLPTTASGTMPAEK